MNTMVLSNLKFRPRRLGFPAVPLLLLTATACGRSNARG